MDDTERRSLFVVVSWHNSPHFTSIFQLDTQGNNHQYSYSPPETQVCESEFSVNFGPSQPLPKGTMPLLQWAYSHLESSTKADLYMLPDWPYTESKDFVAPLHDYRFNTRTKECKRIKLPHGPKYGGNVVAMGGHIYFMPHPNTEENAPDAVFERYNRLNDSWEKLEPFPKDAITLSPSYCGRNTASAVWGTTTLLNVSGHGIWAYDDDDDYSQKWYRVNVNDDRCCDIVGKAVVLENTIYFLSDMDFNSVLALSIEKEDIDGDPVYKCSLLEEIFVPGLEETEFDYGKPCSMSRHLVQMGKDNFVLSSVVVTVVS